MILPRAGLLVAVLAVVACAEPDVLEHTKELMAAGRTEEARQGLRNALDRDPDQADLQLLYGRLLVSTGDLYLAEWPLRKAAEDPEYAVAARRVLAEVLLNTRNAAGAVAVIDRVLEDAPDDLDALDFRSRARVAALDAEGALEDAERVIELAPEHMRARTTRLHALLLLERVEDAEAALVELRARIDVDPSAYDAETRGRLCALECRFRLEKGEVNRAFARVQECLEEFPTDKFVIKEAADHWAARDDFGGLRAMLERALELTPGDTELRVALAGQLRAAGDAAAAEALLRGGIERRESQRPTDWRALYEHFWEVRDYAAAAGALERSIALMERPSSSDLLLLADAQIQLADYQAAARTAERLGEGYRDLIAGRIALERGELRTARESLKRGIRRWPNNATARVLLGEAAARAGNLEEALVEYTEAYRIEYGHNAPPEKSDAALRIARIQAAMGSYEGALDFATRHVNAKPTDPEGIELVVSLAAQLGQEELVTQALRALARVPGEFGRSVALQAELREAREGTQAAIQAIQRWELDLTRPVNFLALEALALLRQQDDSLAALALVERAIAAHPDVPDFEALRGRVLGGIPGREAEARGAFEQALVLDPAHAAAHLGLARMHAAGGVLDSALEAYDAAARADPGNAAIPVEAAALLAEDPSRQAEARARLEAVLDQHPLYAPAASALALLHLADEQDIALSLASRAARYGGTLRSTEAARVLETLGRVQLARGAVKEAISALGQAVELDAELASAHHQLGLAREALRRVEGERGSS